MSLKEQIFAMTLAELGLHSNTANQMVRKACWVWERAGMPTAVYEEERAWLRTQITVEQVVFGFGDYQAGYKPGSSERTFIQRLAELGLTRLDWICMPQSTVTLEMLKRLTVPEVWHMPAIVLGTVSTVMATTVARYIENFDSPYEKVDRLLVGELLEFDGHTSYPDLIESEFRSNLRRGVENTRTVLREMGFGDRDGYFMTFGTRGETQSRIQKKYRLTPELAEQFISIGLEEKWIPQFLD